MQKFGKKALQFGLICLIFWVGFNKIKENWPQPSPEEVAAAEKQKNAANNPSSTSRCEVFTLNPGQGKILITNYRTVEWKTSGGPALVRERDQAWYGQWKQDLPGRGTPFDNSKAHAIEFWVPKNFPRPVTIALERS